MAVFVRNPSPSIGIEDVPKVHESRIRPKYTYNTHQTTFSVELALKKMSNAKPDYECMGKLMMPPACFVRTRILFGEFGGDDLLHIFQLTKEQYRSIAAYAEPIYGGVPRTKEIEDALQRYRDTVTIINATFFEAVTAWRDRMKCEPDYSPMLQTVLEMPSLADSIKFEGEHKIPVISFIMNDIQIRGRICGGKVSQEDQLIRKIGNISVSEILEMKHFIKKATVKQCRIMSYMISKSPILPIVDKDATQVNNGFEALTNITAIFASLDIHTVADLQTAILSVDKIDHDITEGGRQLLYKYLLSNPSIVSVVREWRTDGVSMMEDFITDDVWSTLPVEITRTANAVTLVDNPYTLMPDMMAFFIATERNIELEFEQIVLGMHIYDIACPKWAVKVLKAKDISDFVGVPPEVGFTMGMGYYYLASRGIKFPHIENRKLRLAGALSYAFYICASIFDAGGLQPSATNAMSNSDNFLGKYIADLDTERMELICMALKIPDHELVTPGVLKDIVKRGYIFPLPLSKEVSERHETWKTLTPLQKSMLKRLYGTTPTVSMFCARASNPESVEQLIIGYKEDDEDNVKAIVKQLGIVTPVGPEMDVYLIHNIHHYQFTFDKDRDTTHIATMKDTEILGLLECHCFYTDRPSLVAKANHLLASHRAFFYPFVKSCVNRETFDYVEKTDNPELLLISFGTINIRHPVGYKGNEIEEGEDPVEHRQRNIYLTKGSYHCYQISEINAGFAGYGADDDVFTPQIPDPDRPGSMIPLTRDQTLELRFLVAGTIGYIRKDEYQRAAAQELLIRIQRVDDIFEGGSIYDAKVHAEFVKLPLEARPLIKQWFVSIFELGMYARRWSGPPHPYPMTNKDTLINLDSFVPEVATRQPLAKIYAIQNALKLVSEQSLDFVRALRCVEHARRQVLHTQTPFSQTFHKQYEDPAFSMRMCIRIGSSVLVGTGYYYLKMFFHEEIPDYDPLTLELIN